MGKSVELESNGKLQTLGKFIAQQITESSCHRITFAQFMEWALYHPQWGYYAAAPTKIGATGDFATSPHLGADFGELLAEQLIQMGQEFEPTQPLTLVEMGAGQGLLAKDILTYWGDRAADLLARTEYWIVERSPALVQEQRQQLHALMQAGVSVRWCTLEELPDRAIAGCVFSNELVDALPVHQVIRQGDTLQEIYVTLNPQAPPAAPEFVETVGDLSTPRLAEYLAQLDIDLTSDRYPEGYRTEINLAAGDWLATVAQKLDRGYVITIDYGYPGDRYYHPLRTEGTLQCYYRHRHHSNPYLYIGEQDITAHVNFTALEHYGAKAGLQTVGFTKQGLFLMALGLGDRLVRLSQSDATDRATIQTVLQRRDALQSLINPMGFGGFGVLIQQKGMDGAVSLLGLQGEQ